MLEIFEDLRGIEDLDFTIDEHRDLPLGVDTYDFRMPGLITLRLAERHHFKIERHALFAHGNFRLGTKHAEWTRVQLHWSLHRIGNAHIFAESGYPWRAIWNYSHCRGSGTLAG